MACSSLALVASPLTTPSRSCPSPSRAISCPCNSSVDALTTSSYLPCPQPPRTPTKHTIPAGESVCDLVKLSSGAVHARQAIRQATNLPVIKAAAQNHNPPSMPLSSPFTWSSSVRSVFSRKASVTDARMVVETARPKAAPNRCRASRIANLVSATRADYSCSGDPTAHRDQSPPMPAA
jgi:hypothetical protein